MGARKPNTSANYKSQAFRKRGWTGSNGAFNFAKDCDTIAAFLYYHPLLKKWCGAHNGPEDMSEPDWNEVVRCVRSDQIVENGELVKQSTRGRRKAIAPEAAKTTKVQKHTPTPPRRRGRPRKHHTSPSKAPRTRTSVADVITVAGDTSCSPPVGAQRYAVMQSPAPAGYVSNHWDDEIRSTTRPNIIPSHGCADDNSLLPDCSPLPSPAAIMDEVAHVHSQAESPGNQDPSIHTEDEAFDWLVTNEVWNDQYPLGDLGFGGATPELRVLASDGDGCDPVFEPRPETTVSDSRDAAVICRSAPGHNNLGTSSSQQHRIGHTSLSALSVRERVPPATSRINSTGKLANLLPQRSDLTDIFAIWQRAIQEFSERRVHGGRYELQISTPVAKVF